MAAARLKFSLPTGRGFSRVPGVVGETRSRRRADGDRLLDQVPEGIIRVIGGLFKHPAGVVFAGLGQLAAGVVDVNPVQERTRRGRVLFGEVAGLVVDVGPVGVGGHLVAGVDRVAAGVAIAVGVVPGMLPERDVGSGLRKSGVVCFAGRTGSGTRWF